MDDLRAQFETLRNFSLADVAVQFVDIALVTFLIYRLLVLVRGTRAWRILLGVVAFLLLLWLSDRLRLNTLHWILDKATLLGPVALVILFLPELRQAIEGFGKITPLQVWPIAGNEDRAAAETVEEITAAVAELQSEHVGALIVIEMQGKLTEVISNGVALNARVSAPLLGSIFYGQNPLHDGAVIIRGDTIAAAACRLPLSESSQIAQSLHMRHRAAVGVTETTDCIAIVVSEERGTISVAREGYIERITSANELRDYLNREVRHLENTSREKPRSGRNRRAAAKEEAVK